MITLAEGADWTTKLIEQAPAAGVAVIALLAFLKYLSTLNLRDERMEIMRQQHMKELSDSCHAAHRAVASESNAAISAFTEVLAENNRVIGRANSLMDSRQPARPR